MTPGGPICSITRRHLPCHDDCWEREIYQFALFVTWWRHHLFTNIHRASPKFYSMCRFPPVATDHYLPGTMIHVGNNVSTGVANCLCAHGSVILGFHHELRGIERNKHQNNTPVGTYTFRHDSTYIILFLTRYNALLLTINNTILTHARRVAIALFFSDYDVIIDFTLHSG